VRLLAAEGGRQVRAATEDGGRDPHVVTIDLDVVVVGDDRPVERHRQPGEHVAAVVGRPEHDEVGDVATLDLGGHGRRHRDALQAVGGHGVERADAVLAELRGDRLGVVTGVEGLDLVGQRAGLADDLERDRRRLVASHLGVDPDRVESHLEHLLGLEELDDLEVRLAVVLDDLARLALLGGGHRDDLLASTGLPDLVGREAEVGDADGVDGLRLGRHDPLEGGVAGLHDAGRHGDEERQRGGDLVVAGLVWRSTLAVPSVISMLLAKVIDGRPSTAAICSGTVPV
jgi:hypothetical protein